MAGFSYGNIIYLILIAVFAIISSQRKKKKAQSSNSNVKTKPSFFEELISGGQLNLVPEPNVVYDEEPDTFVFEEEQKPMVEKEVIVSEPLSNNRSKKVFQEETREDNKIDFDLRQAIIYSEILKRKYF